MMHIFHIAFLALVGLLTTSGVDGRHHYDSIGACFLIANEISPASEVYSIGPP